MSEAARIVVGPRPGIAADIVRLHMDYYGPAWGLGDAFEADLVEGTGEFFARYDPARDWFAYARNRHGNTVGTVALDGIDRDGSGGRLRWLIVDGRAGGKGIGRALLAGALDFADANGFARVWLTTFPGLDAARRLYEEAKFELTDETTEDGWGGRHGTQTFVRTRGE